ncbi:Putative biotin holocarboxylase synthetase/biotin-protein ligase [Klebsormidium nitens]|uniref:Putative biotin holocarboxylase synthetase/biotin-protein ligase n=1 Tax=Klebsormidium nitens TaxID=105231 RepID=A0A1Y1IG83_KLENI|nr:Putative biotin holocarboxylase synthetase/biotin-protein ligase [Klebsormidium nitens]|eukprot:GAQ87737.1 Putative biotin holocarboxylase synthetase/biotin-protein ligase [Klebsormidium nitens]
MAQPLVLSAKTEEEESAAYQLISQNALSLPEGVVLEGMYLDHKGGAAQPEVTHTGGIALQSFNPEGYLRHLKAPTFGRVILTAHRLPSTHSLLSQNFQSVPEGTVCVADIQTQGKGRAGNSWESPPGCLMFSFTLLHGDGRTLPHLQYIASLAVAQGVQRLADAHYQAVDLGVRIKWPNDLYARKQKIGGVLCTSSSMGTTFKVTVGIGLNVFNREPTTCLQAILDDLRPGAAPLVKEELLAAVMNRFEELHTTFMYAGFRGVEYNYLNLWLHSGQKVVIKEGGENGEPATETPVTIKGLSYNGFLLASDEKGEQYELSPDGNSLDFFNGLIKRKILSAAG